MRPISTEGFERPKSVSAGPAPALQWLRISDLIIDPAYQRPILGKGRRNVIGIARTFSWSCFAPVVVAPVEGGKFAIIDGQHRTTAAALVGLDSVPCQIVTAAREQQAAAFKAINGIVTPIFRMALHAAALVAREPEAVRLASVCARAEVEILRYPIPTAKQMVGQTMAVGAIAQCLKHYGDATLITALQCVTQTDNNRPGALSARIIKALCHVLGDDKQLRDAGLALLEAFDAIDLLALERAAMIDAAVKKISPGHALIDQIRSQLDRRLSGKAASRGAPRTGIRPSQMQQDADAGRATARRRRRHRS